MAGFGSHQDTKCVRRFREEDGISRAIDSEANTFPFTLMDVEIPATVELEMTAFFRHKERRTGQHVSLLAMTAQALKRDQKLCLASGMES